jgi:hypothetical protein
MDRVLPRLHVEGAGHPAASGPRDDLDKRQLEPTR